MRRQAEEDQKRSGREREGERSCHPYCPLCVKYLTPSWMARRGGVYGHGWSQWVMPWKC